MAFSAKQLTSTTINRGVYYQIGDALTAATINDLVEGVLYATNNNGVSNAIAQAQAASKDASSANSKASSAIATANSALTTASSALAEAQAASSKANSASKDANSALRVANLANSNSDVSLQNSEDALNFAESALSKAEGCVNKLGDTMRGVLSIERPDALLYSNIGYSYFEIGDDEKNYSTSYENGRILFTNNLTKEQSTFNLPNSSGTLALEDNVPRRAQIFIDCNNDRSERTVHAELVINTVLSRFEAKDIVDGESLFQFFRNCGWTSELNGIDAHGFVDDTNLDGTHNAGGILWLSVYSINFHDVYNNSDYDFDEQMVKGVAVKFN